MVRKVLQLIIRLYQLLISPILGPSCRYYPTCSEYAYQALDRHGLIKGSLLTIKRILKCNPFFPGGYDPVPQNKKHPGK